MAIALAVGLITSCHKIEVPVTSELTPDVYPQTDAQFSSASGPVYINLRSGLQKNVYDL